MTAGTLGDVLRENSCVIPVDGGTTYALSGVSSYTNGLFVRGPLAGVETAYKAFHQLRAGQLVLSTLKGWEGAIALTTAEHDGRFVPPHNTLFDFDTSRALPEFVFWGLRRPRIWAQLKDASRGMGARRETISSTRFQQLAFPLPPLDEQRLIVARLDGAAARVEARRLAAAGVERELAATLRAAFARITADAPRARMGDIAPLVRRPVTIDPDAIYPELGVRSFGRGLFAKPNVTGSELTWQSLFRIEEGDLVFSNIKAWEGAFAVAGAEHHGKHGSHRYLTCVPDAARATPGFLHHYLQSEEGLDQIGRASPGSADRNRTFAQKRMEAINIPVPSLDAQRWFDRLQDRARAARAAHTEAATHLDRLLPAMLHEAFGE